MASFLQRREQILDQFETAKKELETLNEEIRAEIQLNSSRIAELNEANKQLSELVASNTVSIKSFSKFFGK